MSLYAVQKFLFHLNRDVQVQQRFQTGRAALLADYDLSDDERSAIQTGDIGKLYVLCLARLTTFTQCSCPQSPSSVSVPLVAPWPPGSRTHPA